MICTRFRTLSVSVQLAFRSSSDKTASSSTLRTIGMQPCLRSSARHPTAAELACNADRHTRRVRVRIAFSVHEPSPSTRPRASSRLTRAQSSSLSVACGAAPTSLCGGVLPSLRWARRHATSESATLPAAASRATRSATVEIARETWASADCTEARADIKRRSTPLAQKRTVLWLRSTRRATMSVAERLSTETDALGSFRPSSANSRSSSRTLSAP
mmetsp:Transcript_32738/g.81502  ORF Transcript_32738/g.81502 Transcript_32738/m.81502 type:complete len:216 (-) Transcript_32738:157-804(-)